MLEADALGAWFERVARPLPWRMTRDPYAIWISEVMLQQTQVATVIPYYHRFLEAFPTVEALAEAPEDAVLARWSGLGYYSRARNLQRGARYLVDKYGGQFPRERQAALAVPGVGPYTAGAVLSIAFDLPMPIVDGNVQRVFARWYRFETEIESKAARDFFWEKAELWVRHSRSPRVLNQALMELGATLCIKGKPRCEQCPIAESCAGKETAESLPRRRPRREKVELDWQVVVLRWQREILLRRNPEGAWWHGLWDFPRVRCAPPSARLLGTTRHTVTHHRLTVRAFSVEAGSKSLAEGVAGDGEFAWYAPEAVASLALSSLARKVWAVTMEACSDDDFGLPLSPSSASAPQSPSGSRGSPPASS